MAINKINYMQSFFKLSSSKLLIEIRQEITNCKNYIEKRYFGLLESLIITIDCLDDANADSMVNKFLNDLEFDELSETNSMQKKLLFLTSLTLKICLLKWKNDFNLTISKYEIIIHNLQNEIYKIYSTHQQTNNFIVIYCKQLYKIPHLALLKLNFNLYPFLLSQI